MFSSVFSSEDLEMPKLLKPNGYPPDNRDPLLGTVQISCKYCWHHGCSIQNHRFMLCRIVWQRHGHLYQPSVYSQGRLQQGRVVTTTHWQRKKMRVYITYQPNLTISSRMAILSFSLLHISSFLYSRLSLIFLYLSSLSLLTFFSRTSYSFYWTFTIGLKISRSSFFSGFVGSSVKLSLNEVYWIRWEFLRTFE